MLRLWTLHNHFNDSQSRTPLDLVSSHKSSVFPSVKQSITLILYGKADRDKHIDGWVGSFFFFQLTFCYLRLFPRRQKKCSTLLTNGCQLTLEMLSPEPGLTATQYDCTQHCNTLNLVWGTRDLLSCSSWCVYQMRFCHTVLCNRTNLCMGSVAKCYKCLGQRKGEEAFCMVAL